MIFLFSPLFFTKNVNQCGIDFSPAAVATDFVKGRDRAALEIISSKTPLKRVVEPEDVALSIMACITHLKTATGTKIVVDGGRHL